MPLKGQRALVTGASSGLGRGFAEELAARGASLVVTARRAERLSQLAVGLRERHGTQVLILPLDLTDPTAVRELFERTEGDDLPIDILVNCAGFGTFGDFMGTPFPRAESMLRLNVLSLTEITYRFAQKMCERQRGHILNVASFTAYLPVPGYAAYAASKAYVRNFTEAIAPELAPKGVRVLSLCPGAMPTEFWEVAGQTRHGLLIRASMTGSELVVRKALRALFGWRRNIVPGFLNKLGCFFTRFISRRTGIFIASRIAGKTNGRTPP